MRTATLMAIALLAGSAHAQGKPVAGAPPAPRPAAELERLKPLEGRWSCKGVAPAGAMGPGSAETKYASTFTIKRAWDGFAYTLAYDQKPPSRFSGAWSVAWDGGQKKLLFFWLDNAGNVGLETASDWSGDAFVAQGEGFAPGGPATFRDTFTRRGDKGLHWKGEVKPQGASAWTVIGEDECMKK